MPTLEKTKQQRESVGMGEIKLATHPVSLCSVLGSCIGLAMFDLRLKLGALAHVVLPESDGRDGPPGKFADTAVPHMIALLERQGARRRNLLVKISGGAQMFNASGPLQIGAANAEAVRRALDAFGLRIQAEDVGGTAGRRITADCSTGKIVICRVGHDDVIL